MNTIRSIEVFSAGCSLCNEALELVQSLACPACNVTVRDMRDDAVAARAKQLGVSRLPAVAIDGQLVSCCKSGGLDKQALAAAGLGQPA